MNLKFRTEIDYFFSGLSFYTRIPCPSFVTFKPDSLTKSRKYLPFIGLLVGAVAAMTYWVSSLLFPMAVSVLLSMISTVFLTGAFHEDGLADTADGFGGGWDKAQVLAIMKDSRVGAYGVIALILILGLKFSILIELANESSGRVVLALFCGHAISRLMALMPMQYYEYVSERETSKSHTVASMKLGGYELLFSTIPVVGLLIVSWQVGFILAVMAAIAVTVLLSRYFKVRIGGYTGDCLGSIQQLSELVFYLILLA